MAKVTIIVPVYRVEAYLPRCVRSLLDQTFRDFELVLVDDGSPDACGVLCEEFAREDPRVVVLHRSNGGLSAARNTGIEWAFAHSDAPYFTFVDSDDWVEADFLARLMEGISSGVRMACVSHRIVHDGDVVSPVPRGPWQVMKPEDFWPITQTIASTAWGKLYDRQLFAMVRFPEGKVHEDQLTAYKIVFQVDCVAFADDRSYCYFQRGDSLANCAWTPVRLDRLQAWLEEIPFFESRDLMALANRSRSQLEDDCVEALRHLPELKRSGRYREVRQLLRSALRGQRASVYRHHSAYVRAYPALPRFFWWVVSKISAIRERGLIGEIRHLCNKIFV